MVKLISNIDKKIWKVLEKLKLFPLESPENFIARTNKTKHRYSTVCQNEKGEKFLFLCRLHESPFEKEKMKTEIKLANFLQKRNFPFFPKYFASKIEKDFEWLVREYFEEGVLEDQGEIEKLKRQISEEEIEKICQALLEIQKIKISGFPFLKEKEIKNFFLLPDEIEKRKILKEKERKKIKKLIEENKKFLKEENKYFSHGDFSIGNLIFLPNGNLKIIDLESAMISNFAYDICFLWIRLWREKIKRKILEKFYSLLSKEKKEKFKLLFQLNSLFLGFHSFCASPKEYSKEMLKKRKKFYLNLLKKAIVGFESLRKI